MWDYPLHNGEEAKTPEPSAWLFLRVFPKRSCFKVIKNRHRMIGFNFLLNSFAHREKKKFHSDAAKGRLFPYAELPMWHKLLQKLQEKVELGWKWVECVAETVGSRKQLKNLCIWGPVTQTVCVVWRYTTQLLQSENLLILRGSDFPFTLWFMAYRTVELMQWWQADKSLNIKHQLDIVLFIRVVKNCDFCYFKWCWMR